MNAKEIAQTIAFELMNEYDQNEQISDDTLEKESYMAVADLKGDIKEEAIAILKGHGYEVEE